MLTAAFLFLLLPGCGPLVGFADEDSRVRVVCTTGQVGDMLANIGGEHIDVRTLMGAGVDPHLYKATPGDIRLLKGAKVIFYNGLHLEGRLADVLEKLAERKPTFAVIDEIHRDHPERLRQAPEFPTNFDPHIWFDVGLWAECADYAARRLIEVDPAHAADYRKNADLYIARLKKLDADTRAQLAEIPKEQRVLVTAHDAFGYCGRAYDVEVHGLQGISTADEADLGAINDLVRLLTSRRVKAVFIETSVPPKNIRSLIQGCEAAGHPLTLGGELYSDAMGPAGTPEGTYVGMIEYNTQQIVRALR
jgi:manganese/zinc/iron transport system substrate-binding protein